MTARIDIYFTNIFLYCSYIFSLTHCIYIFLDSLHLYFPRHISSFHLYFPLLIFSFSGVEFPIDSLPVFPDVINMNLYIGYMNPDAGYRIQDTGTARIDASPLVHQLHTHRWIARGIHRGIFTMCELHM